MSEKKSGAAKKKILIVDDHPIMRKGLVDLISQEQDLEVCGEAEDRSGALDVMENAKPDAAIVDLSLKESSGLELVKDIQIRCPNLPVLVVSMHEESFYAERVLRNGAMGYVMKAEHPSKVIEGLRQILAGNIYVSERTSARMLSKMVGGKGNSTMSPIERLSDREFEVFQLIGMGIQTKDIAKRLHLSSKTVEAHREHIKKKLNLDGATDLLKYAIQWVQLERGS